MGLRPMDTQSLQCSSFVLARRVFKHSYRPSFHSFSPGSSFVSKRKMEDEEVSFANLDELEQLAMAKMSKMGFDYYRSGSDDEITLRANREAWKRISLIPRMLVDVSQLKTSCEILGFPLPSPILVAPMAMQRLAHPDGEFAVARASEKFGIPMMVSTMATASLSQVASVDPRPLQFFQLYVLKNRKVVASLVQDAERLGYQALVVTVDAPYLGRREADERNKFHLPEGLRLQNLERLRDPSLMSYGQTPDGSSLTETFAKQIDPSLTWEIVAWLKQITKLPILIKGILSPADAQLAVNHGVHGIIVSNHGGRQLDTAVPAADVLFDIVQVVRGRIPVMVDGGIRRGTDIFKALALGADAVLLGRPILYGLAFGGQKGVEKVLEKIMREFRLAMALCGCQSIQDIQMSHLHGAPSLSHQSRL